MPTLQERIDQEIREAARARDQVRLDAVRMLKSAVKYREIELGAPLDDAGVLQVVAQQIKQRRDSRQQFLAGGRADLAQREEREAALLQEFLPPQLSPEELSARIEAAVEKAGARSIREMGAVMKLLMPEVQGRADARAVAEQVKARLGASPPR